MSAARPYLLRLSLLLLSLSLLLLMNVAVGVRVVASLDAVAFAAVYDYVGFVGPAA